MTDDMEAIRRQVAEKAKVSSGRPSTGDLITEPVLVVNQRAKLFELTNEYLVFNQQGMQVGSVRQVGQTALRKVVRALTKIDAFLPHRLEIVDAGGRPRLRLYKGTFSTWMSVARADGTEIGRLGSSWFRLGKARLRLVDPSGADVGVVAAENWRGWNYRIEDANGVEVGRITKTWAGLGKELFTTADNYVVQFHRPLLEPIRSLALSAALAVDTLLKQGEH